MKNCKPFKKQLTDFIYGELNVAAKAALEEHLSSCAHCRAELEELRGTLSLLDEALETAPAPEALNPWRSLRRPVYVPKNRFEQFWYSPQLKSVLAASALASIFLVISGSIIVFRYMPEKPAPVQISYGYGKADAPRPRVAVDKYDIPNIKPTLSEEAVSQPMLEDVPMPEPASMMVALSREAGFSSPGYDYAGFTKPGAHAMPSDYYDWIPENAFQVAMDHPLSSFSIDVDRASYANVRRFLNDNQLPPVEVVRIEEMINSFDYDYPQPAGEDPFAIAVEVGRCPWNDGHELAMIGLQGSGDPVSDKATTIARGVKIEVEFNPAQVKAYRLIGYENRVMANADFDNDQKDAGELGAGHTVTALYELVPAGSDEPVPLDGDLKYQRTQLVDSDDLMTVKLRYKQPDSDVSKLLVRTVNTNDFQSRIPSANFRFASEVAEFGLLLRNSAFKASADYERIIQRTKAVKGEDPEGYRAEFIHMVERARLLDNGDR